MDPEPGPEVTHVRDARGVKWRRGDGGWWGDIGHGYDDFHQWPEVVARGPVTDASDEPD
jgi:hypothetical protein